MIEQHLHSEAGYQTPIEVKTAYYADPEPTQAALARQGNKQELTRLPARKTTHLEQQLTWKAPDPTALKTKAS